MHSLKNHFQTSLLKNDSLSTCHCQNNEVTQQTPILHGLFFMKCWEEEIQKTIFYLLQERDKTCLHVSLSAETKITNSNYCHSV